MYPITLEFLNFPLKLLVWRQHHSISMICWEIMTTFFQFSPISPPFPNICYSILGMNLFGCKFCRKSYDQKESCDRKNFDSLLWAIVTVFQVLSPAHRLFHEKHNHYQSVEMNQAKHTRNKDSIKQILLKNCIKYDHYQTIQMIHLHSSMSYLTLQ